MLKHFSHPQRLLTSWLPGSDQTFKSYAENILRIKLKVFFSRLSNWLTIVMIIFLFWRIAPQALKNFQSQGTSITSQEFIVLSSSQKISSITFPPPNKKIVSIFWATWCGPCKIEMQRLQKSIDDKIIDAFDIVAINPFESPDEVKVFLKQNKYDFTFIHAPEISALLNITTTPTTILIDDRKIISQSSGMSIIGIWKTENFLNNNQ